MCRALAQYPIFALGCSKVAVVFFGLCIFWVQNLPQLRMHGVLLSPTVPLYFAAGGDLYRDASIAALQQRVPGPRPGSPPTGHNGST